MEIESDITFETQDVKEKNVVSANTDDEYTASDSEVEINVQENGSDNASENGSDNALDNASDDDISEVELTVTDLPTEYDPKAPAPFVRGPKVKTEKGEIETILTIKKNYHRCCI